ncbi:MAG: SidA/IucD/PvdA family monooxygenase [Chloroflexi bacterium]|nr:SidA/IucD/PvdA family monooxygenase [Chloroflexota bacterium]
MGNQTQTHHYDTIVIGGGQAGLATGYYLKQQQRDFVILDANQRVGDSWRKRWDSLRLFTPACYDALPGMPFPAAAHTFPTKDDMADYLEAYARRFDLPLRTGTRVEHLSKQGNQFVLEANDQQYTADHVVVAMSSWQKSRIPPFASELDADIIQLHAGDYRSPSQLRDGGVLIVGAGNSGADIALDVAHNHTTWLSGRDTGQIPFRIESFLARLVLIHIVLGLLFHRILTIKTPMGRKMRQEGLAHGMPLIRVKPKDIADANIQRLPRTIGVRDGRPLLEDGRVLDVANVIWCTGFRPNFSWIEFPIFNDGEPIHERGVVSSVPGLYFVGLNFLYAVSSGQVQGVGRDAKYVARQIALTRASTLAAVPARKTGEAHVA